TFLARKGWKVTLLEKDTHPLFHNNETLLRMNLPILERHAVLEQVRQNGVNKLRTNFPRRGNRDSVNVFRFDRALNPRFGHAFQVKRAEFDALLSTTPAPAAWMRASRSRSSSWNSARTAVRCWCTRARPTARRWPSARATWSMPAAATPSSAAGSSSRRRIPGTSRPRSSATSAAWPEIG